MEKKWEGDPTSMHIYNNLLWKLETTAPCMQGKW